MSLWLIFAIIPLFGVFFFLFIRANKILNLYLYPKRVLNKKKPEDFGLNYENFNVQVNGEKIYGWFFEGKKDVVLIFVPGFITNRSFILEKVWPLLKRKEFNVVIFDPRGQGDSQGDFLMGAFMEEDISAIIDWLKKNKNLDKFILFGTSLGATVAIIVASKRKDVIATIADSPFMNVYKISSKALFGVPPILAKIFLPFAKMILFLKFGQDLFRKLDVLSKIDKVSHIFFIHGKKDKLFSFKHSLALYQKAKKPKKIWLTSAQHCQSFRQDPEIYLQKILEFIKSQIY